MSINMCVWVSSSWLYVHTHVYDLLRTLLVSLLRTLGGKVHRELTDWLWETAFFVLRDDFSLASFPPALVQLSQLGWWSASSPSRCVGTFRRLQPPCPRSTPCLPTPVSGQPVFTGGAQPVHTQAPVAPWALNKTRALECVWLNTLF